MEDSKEFKVLMTADPISGVWTYALDLAKSLKQYNVYITMALMGRNLKKAQAVEAASISNLEVLESNYKPEWMDDPWKDVQKAGEWLLDLEEKIWPDIVHLNGYAHASLPWQTPVVVAAHSCLLSWWENVRKEPVPLYLDTYKNKVSRGLKAADAVVAPTKWMLGSLEKCYGPVPRKQVINNGRDSTIFYKEEKQAFVFSMGRIWDEAKNISLIDQAAACIEAPVFVAGEEKPSDMEYLRNLHYLGQLDTAAVAYWLAKASVYALPVRHEPFGLTMLEAALSGCALVTGDTPSMREVWKDAAIYVSPDDKNELAKVCNKLLADKDHLHKMAEKAYQRAQKFRLETMAAKYLKLYGQLCGINERSKKINGLAGIDTR